METFEVTNQLLKNKYDLHKSQEVDAAAKRTKQRTGEKVPQDPLIRIQNYLDRLDNTVNPPPLEGHPRFGRKERNLAILKKTLYNKFVIKPDEIPESYWEHQRRIICERGQGGDLEQVDWEELKRQNAEVIIADQKASLDKWIDYSASPDSAWIPDALKYYALRSVFNMGEYDKEKKVYTQRSRGTTKPFPDLNREALAYVLDALNKKYHRQQVDLSSFESGDQQQFEKLLQAENFAKLYAWAIDKVTPVSPEQLVATSGEWVEYRRGTNHMSLVRSLQGHGTGWCTVGESAAKKQLQGGNFYVFYSLGQDGKPTIPRAAIRMVRGEIAEVRGIATDQNLDPGAVSLVEEKLKEFPDGERYKKRVRDMKLLTVVDHKVHANQSLTRQEVIFLYEIDSPIEGFGQNKDPRIVELRSQRNLEEDMPILVGCEKGQIARSIKEIGFDTKVYVGPLEPGIFDLVSKYNIEHVYMSFPEKEVLMETIEIGGKSPQQLEVELNKAGVRTGSDAKSMINSPDFTTFQTSQIIETVRLRVQDLSFSEKHPTIDQIYRRAKELGLELCPAEIGPHLGLKYANQSVDTIWIGMKPIVRPHGHPSAFILKWEVYKSALIGLWVEPTNTANLDDVFIFSLRKQT